MAFCCQVRLGSNIDYIPDVMRRVDREAARLVELLSRESVVATKRGGYVSLQLTTQGLRHMEMVREQLVRSWKSFADELNLNWVDLALGSGRSS